MMSGIRSKNTKPEIIIRSLLHRNGYRFRLHQKNLPGKPDIVLKKHNVAIFVNGCFWHGHKDCHLFRLPKSKVEFWKEKIGSNKIRDTRKQKALLEQGWRVLVIWECAIKGSKKLTEKDLSENVSSFLEDMENMRLNIRGSRD